MPALAAFQVPAIAIDNSPTSGIGSVSPNSVSPTGSVTSPAWAFFDDLEDHEPDFADELDDGLGDEDEVRNSDCNLGKFREI